jgi:hypothetical protein
MKFYFNALACCILLFLSACSETPKPTAASPEVTKDSEKEVPMPGSDKDEHGCKGSAGYQWSVVKKECIRVFESGIRLDPKAAQLDKTTSAFVVFKSDNDDAIAEIFLPNSKETTLLKKVADQGAGTWKSETLSLSQWKGMYTLSDKANQTLYQGPGR